MDDKIYEMTLPSDEKSGFQKSSVNNLKVLTEGESASPPFYVNKKVDFKENLINIKEGAITDDDKQKEILCQSRQGERDFIHRNIELAPKAMTKTPLTDEEKCHLEEIIANIEDSKSDEEDELNNATNLVNAFHLNEDDKKRLSEIDSQLEDNYQETKHLRPQDDITNNFWKNLVLEQMLKDIDNKLAVIKEKDEEKTKE